jgi:cytochrome P450
MAMVMGPTILAMDPPEHGRYRDLIQAASSKKARVRWEEERVRPRLDPEAEDAQIGRGFRAAGSLPVRFG